MTLIELVVIIAILSIFMGIAIPTVAKSFQSTAQARKITSRYPEAWRALNQVSESIRETYPTALSSGGAFSGRNGSYDLGAVNLPSDELFFPVLDTGYAHLGSVHRVTYRLELNPQAEDSPKGLVRIRAALGAANDAGAKESILDEVIGLDFKYLDDSAASPEWVQEWPPPDFDRGGGPESPESAHTRLPRAVRITIFVLGDSSGRPSPFTTVVNIPSRQAN